MGDTKKVIGLFLFLLLLIIGLGVFINRYAEQNKDNPEAADGVLERILFRRDEVLTPTPTPATRNTLVIEDQNSTEDPQKNNTNMVLGNETSEAPSQPESKGGVQPDRIPETGTPTIVVFLALAGLSSGVILKKTH